MDTHYPNILYIHSHDTGRFVQPYGHAIDTPHIQQLAEQGVLFRKAFSAAPTCSPSRASLLTGQCAHSNGMLGLASRGLAEGSFKLHDYKQHLQHTLQEAGYFTALIGEEHIAKDRSSIGYNRVAKVSGYQADIVAPTATAMLSELHKNQTQPFFLSVGFFETHRAFLKPGSIEDANYSLPPAPLPDTPETRTDIASFKASARKLDQGIGAVLNALEDEGLAENTLVICTTDHGIAFPRMKANLTDQGIGVLLIMRGPGGFTGGKVYDAIVSQLDIYPTICDLLSIERPHWLQGTSLLPLINGEVERIHDAIFAEVNYHAAYEPQRCVRTQRWKYIRRFDPYLWPVLPNTDDGPSKNLYMRYGWKERPMPMEQLYDLIFDPYEMNNLANDLSTGSILQDLRNRLDAWMRRTDDPLLHGSIPAPSGFELNGQDQISPSDPVHIV